MNEKRTADNEEFVRYVQEWLLDQGHALAVDGHAGALTRAAFLEETGYHPPQPLAAVRTWPRPHDTALRAYYGPPGTGLVMLELPYPMRLAWDKTTVVTKTACHQRVRESLRGCLEGVLRHYGSLEEVKRAGMDLLGGVFNLRKMRGSEERWSLHAYGAAIDLDPERNGLRTLWPDVATMPLAVIEIFEDAGWTSLARAVGRDAMHFQATSWP